VPVVVRFAIDRLIQSWALLAKQILEVASELVKRSETKIAEVYCLKAIPGISAMGAITLLLRIGDIKRFKNPDNLANYFGLTPGCHNTGGKHRVGGITKRVARQVLNFAVLHIAV
jgi:transposase